MFRVRRNQGWKLMVLVLVLFLGRAQTAWADEPTSGGFSGGFGGPCGGSGYGSGGCCHHFCCPHIKFCLEGPPRICIRQGCPKPTINPCEQPNWGYYQPCWAPWPWPPDWSHCPVQPPATLVFPPGAPLSEVRPQPNNFLPPTPLPYPRKVGPEL